MNGLIRVLESLHELAPATNDTSLNDEARQARRLMSLPLGLEKFVFDEDTFPAVAAADAAQLQELVRPHEINVTFYDRNYNKVRQAAQPGRYGAVIEIVPQHGSHHGRTTRRFRTFFACHRRSVGGVSTCRYKSTSRPKPASVRRRCRCTGNRSAIISKRYGSTSYVTTGRVLRYWPAC